MIKYLLCICFVGLFHLAATKPLADIKTGDVSSSGLQCYSCMGSKEDCETGIPVPCPPLAKFCKLEYTASTGFTVQGCATSSDCENLETTSINGDINNCSNYEKGNCIGIQCGESKSNVSSSDKAFSKIQCFSCMGSSGDCEAETEPTPCSSEFEFCKLEWTAATGYTSQSCATKEDCSNLKTSDDIGDINNCANYDKSNCIGSHCSSETESNDTAAASTDINNCATYDMGNCIGKQCNEIPETVNNATTPGIKCFSCMGETADCESNDPITCPLEFEFCKLEWTVATGFVVQACAKQSDCQV